MRRLLLAVLVAMGCSKPAEYVRREDGSNTFSAELPSSWQADGDKDLARLPIAVVSYVGAVDSRDESIPLGAVINVTRVTRVAAEQPPESKGRKAFLAAWILPSEVVFGASPEGLRAELRKHLPARVEDATLGGKPARTYSRDYVHENPLHMRGPVRMRLTDYVVRTDAAFYIVEYRATAKRYDEFKPVFERFLKSFTFGPRA
ncbi:MAG: hypothetical protein HYZ75_09700 [Elusimicrobia bacterium]|nr:hypothetical protein [Elusimicrobiota bacterium]